jgi:hypothetical protein
MKTTAAADMRFRNGSTPSRLFPATIRISVNTSTGTSPVQNFDHRKSFSEIGAVRMIQNAAPSAETAGNTKRTVTVDITKPAIARFRNAYMFFKNPLMYGMRSRSRTRKL